MFSFLISLVLLVLGYFLYGKFVEKVFSPDPTRKTPAIEKADGVDFIKMPSWKVFMIQFLNIAGTGPIFGAIMGAKFGPSAYLWIVLGCIFAGAVHDYFTGMLSARNGGAGLPELVGKYLGKGTRAVLLVFTVFLLVMVGSVFVYSPAAILGDMTAGWFQGGNAKNTAVLIWLGIIFAYFLIATLMPVDKIIGRIYPVFAFSLLFMALALMIGLLVKWPAIPEVWDGLQNRTGNPATPIFPCLFITIACGAVSGFHATQSPLMARCMANEKEGRPIFYGAMITEGIVALVWAAVSSYFFFAGGQAELGAEGIGDAPRIVNIVSKGWLGVAGGILAILGVVAAPITSGDTALRSARLIIADALHLEQKKIWKRLSISIPLFVVTGLLVWFSIKDNNGFELIWRYFGWSNQTIATFMLWTITVYLVQAKGKQWYLVTLLPACFMTAVVTTYILIAKIGFNVPAFLSPWIGLGTFCLSAGLFYLWHARYVRTRTNN